MSKKSIHTLSILAGLFAFSVGPIGFVVQRLVAQDLSAHLIVALQMTFGAVALLAITAIATGKAPRLYATIVGLFLGVIHPGAFMIMFIYASTKLDGVTAVLLLATLPALVAILGHLILKEGLSSATLLGLGVSFVGMILLAHEREATGENQVAGYLVAIPALIIAALGFVSNRAIGKYMTVAWYEIAVGQVTGAAIVSWSAVLVLGTSVSGAAVMEHVPAFLYLGLIMTAAGYLSYNFAISRLETPKVGLLAAAGPGIGALAAAYIFNSPINSIGMIAVLIVIFGAALPSLYFFVSKPFRPRSVPRLLDGAIAVKSRG